MFASLGLTLLIGSGLQVDSARSDQLMVSNPETRSQGRTPDSETPPRNTKLKLRVVAGTYDPDDTDLVESRWMFHIGLPDAQGDENSGLFLSKNGRTSTNAAAGADIRGVKGINLTELGYDIRNGGHCGAGAPRFDVITTDKVDHFVGCSSPSPVVSAAPATADGATTGWRRLRWTAAQLAAAFPPIKPTDVVSSISIVFDEGVDTGPDFSGMAIIDNIDVNGTLAGQE